MRVNHFSSFVDDSLGIGEASEARCPPNKTLTPNAPDELAVALRDTAVGV